MVDPTPRYRARQQGGHSSFHAEGSAYPSARACTGCRLFWYSDRPVQPRTLAASDRQEFGVSIMETGFLTAIPGLVGALAMIFWTRHSDATGERKWHMIIPSLLGGFALAASASVSSPIISYVYLTIAGGCIYAALPSFWPLPTAILSGAAAAGGIALINALGNLGGFVGPFFVGWMKDLTGAFAGGLYGLAGFMGPYCRARSSFILRARSSPRTRAGARPRGTVKESMHVEATGFGK